MKKSKIILDVLLFVLPSIVFLIALFQNKYEYCYITLMLLILNVLYERNNK